MLRTMTRRSFFPNAPHILTPIHIRIHILIHILILIRTRTPTPTPVLPIIPPAPLTVSHSTITAAADAAERG